MSSQWLPSGGCRYSACCDPAAVRDSGAQIGRGGRGRNECGVERHARSGSDSAHIGAAVRPAHAAGAPNTGRCFPECGGISDQTIAEQTRVPGWSTPRATRSGVSGWRAVASSARTSRSPGTAAARSGASARPRSCRAPASRTSTSRAMAGSSRSARIPTLGDNLCEIAIQFDDDFIEWSISFAEKPFPRSVRRGQGIDPPVDSEREMSGVAAQDHRRAGRRAGGADDAGQRLLADGRRNRRQGRLGRRAPQRQLGASSIRTCSRSARC